MNLNVLKKISDILNASNCTWAIGGSLLLYFHKLIETPNDIDILINAKDLLKVQKEFEKIGINVNLPSKEPFRTNVFLGYKIDETVIELIGDFKIALDDRDIYEFILDETSIVDSINLDNSIVYCTSLEDWFVAYMVMNDPKNRTPIIEDYFNKNGIKYRNLLERNLNQNLPQNIKNEIKSLL